MKKTKKKAVKNFADGLAKCIYDAYPAADLLPIKSPTAKTRLEDFLERVENGQAGDTLFEFIVRELLEGANEDGVTREGCVRLLDRAADDILAVRNAIEAHNRG